MRFNRKIVKIIEKWLYEKEIIILAGPRQVGKTTLLKILMDKLKQDIIKPEKIFYLNLEELDVLATLNESPDNLLDYITEKKGTNYFFIDEIQYLDNPSNFLKHVYDKYGSSIKLIITGSSNLEIKAKFQDSLAGRKVTFMINPLDFEEYLKFKKFPSIKYLYQVNLPLEIKNTFDKELEEYLVYGGMPAVVLQTDKTKKEKLLNEYVSAYINQDIRAFGRVENIGNFNKTVKILAGQIGNLLNVNELASSVGISRRETERYLELLEFTYVFFLLRPYAANVRTSLTKMPKFYFFDTGIRNALLGNLLASDSRSDIGALFENFVFMELKNEKGLYFYRSTGQREIDFLQDKNQALYLLEVKYQKLKKGINERILVNFPTQGKLIKPYVLNLSYNSKGKSGVEYIDYRFVGRFSQ
jgi:uncharacterized protein